MGRKKKTHFEVYEEPVYKHDAEQEEIWLDLLKEALGDKKQFRVLLGTLKHVSGILCLDCLQSIPMSENCISHNNGHLCGATRINGLIRNLEKEKTKRNL